MEGCQQALIFESDAVKNWKKKTGGAMDDNGGKHDLNCSNISSGEDNIMMN